MKETHSELMAVILENILTGVWVTDAQDTITYANKGMGLIAGVPENDMIGANIITDFPENVIKFFKPYYNNAKTKLEKTKYSGVPITTPSGRESYQSGWLVPIVRDNQFAGMICTVEDVTDQREAEQELEKSKAFNDTILNTSLDVIYVYDIQQKKNVYSNNGVSNVLGYSAEEIKEMGDSLIATLMHPKDFQGYVKEIVPRYMVARDNELIEHEYRMKHKSGKWIWLRSRESIFERDNNGIPKQIFGILHDVTQRKEDALNLMSSNVKWETLFNTMTEMVVLHDIVKDDAGNVTDYRITDCNQAFSDITGIKRDQAIGKLATELYQSSPPPYLEEYNNVALTGKPHHFNVYYEPMEKHFAISAVSMQPGQFATITTDITAVKTTELSLKESEEKFKILFESSRDAIMMLAPPTWKFIEGNQATVDLFRTATEDNFTTLGPWDLSPEKQPDGQDSSVKAKKMIDIAMKKGSHFFEWTHKRYNGDDFPATVLLTKVELSGKSMLQATVRDISLQKEAEREKEEMQKQIFHSSKLASIGELAAGVAHEINNPLSIIKGHLYEVEDDLAEDDFTVKELLNRVKRLNLAVERIEGIVKGMRSLARSEADKIENFDICKYIDDTINFSKVIYEKEGIKITRDLQEKDLFITGNKGHFQQIIMNLLSNSKDALSTEMSGSIHIQAGKKEGRVFVSLSDNGCGIRKENLEHIFNPFFTTKEHGKGTGLGLGITRSLTDRMDGVITVDSTPGKGSAFTITFPLAKPANKREMLREKTRFEKLSGHVLVVDDEEDIRDLLYSILNKFGYTVDLAKNGVDALNFLNKNTYDIIFTDIKMPVMNGKDLIREIRKRKLTSSKIIVISGTVATQNEIIENFAQDYETQGFIEKPFSKRQIYDTILKALNK